VIIRGEKVVLKPMSPGDITRFFEWATKSDGALFWYGGPLFGEPIPTFEIFKDDWQSYYFDGRQPEKGRCFMIQVDDRDTGQVNYNHINRIDNSTELDIIIAASEDKGKGYGTDALKTLSAYLFRKLNIDNCFIEPISTNKRAIRAYEKSGFKTTQTYQVLHMELRKKKDG